MGLDSVETMVEKAKDNISKWGQKLREFYKENKTISDEGSLASQLKTFGKIREMFMEALSDTRENFWNAGTVSYGTRAQKNTAEGGTDVAYSVRAEFYKEFDAWDKKDTHVSFIIGTTSDILKSIGMRDQNIVLRSGTVLQKLKDHPAMKLDILNGIPELLELRLSCSFFDAIDPKTKRPKYDSSITVLGELYANVVENGKTVQKPVLVSLELLPTKNKGATVLNFAIIKSAYSKNALQRYLNENSILYIDPDKKLTPGSKS